MSTAPESVPLSPADLWWLEMYARNQAASRWQFKAWTARLCVQPCSQEEAEAAMRFGPQAEGKLMEGPWTRKAQK